MTAVIQELNSELARLSRQVHASLVRVESGRWGAGAGTIWHSEGLILTNSHVARSRRLSITLPDGRRVPARLLARSRDLDLAALAVELSDLPTMEIGDSGTLQPGTLGDGLRTTVGSGRRCYRRRGYWAGRGIAGSTGLRARLVGSWLALQARTFRADRWSILPAAWSESTPSWWAQMWGLRYQCMKSSDSSNTPCSARLPSSRQI